MDDPDTRPSKVYIKGSSLEGRWLFHIQLRIPKSTARYSTLAPRGHMTSTDSHGVSEIAADAGPDVPKSRRFSSLKGGIFGLFHELIPFLNHQEPFSYAIN